MGLWDSIKKLTKPYEDEYLDDELEEPSRSPFARQESRSYMDYAEAPAVQDNSVRHTFLNSVRSAAGGEKSGGERGSVSLGGGAQTPMKLMVMRPTRFAEAAGIADSMRERNSVFINLEALDRDEARRLVYMSKASVLDTEEVKNKREDVLSAIFAVVRDFFVANAADVVMVEELEKHVNHRGYTAMQFQVGEGGRSER